MIAFVLEGEKDSHNYERWIREKLGVQIRRPQTPQTPEMVENRAKRKASHSFFLTDEGPGMR